MDDDLVFGLTAGTLAAVVIGMIMHSIWVRFDERRWAAEWTEAERSARDAELSVQTVLRERDKLRADEAEWISYRRGQEVTNREMASLLKRLQAITVRNTFEGAAQ